tara:strand:- start:1012 stop:1281 length:270 start_codon:yes stop_codon:yes gene_type:complete
MKEMENPDLTKQIVPSESELKEIIVNYVGNIKNPENDEVTVEDVVEVFSQQFPEFLLAIAEENWVNGYSQALSDVRYLEQNKKKDSHDD